MTLNRELFAKDPLTTRIPNLGVTKVGEPETPEEWEVLRYELTSFVCDGAYRQGLERILSTYLGNLDRPQQPAVWVSGFYGSGKSHLVRVLEYLWRDTVFPDGATARGLVHLPDDIVALFRELSTDGHRAGGLWSAAGTLGAGAGDNVRLALLSIVLRSARLPADWAPARFVIWLKQEGYYDAVRQGVEALGRAFDHELNNMLVSGALAESLLAADPTLAASPTEVHQLLRTQFPPNLMDISDEELLGTMEDVLLLQTTTPGKLPCTLLVVDELQQFIGEDPTRALQVQTIVEACSSRFGASVLFVATGQAALQATPQLSKLQGRFTVRVMLSDTDVEHVVREVVLRKRPDRIGTLRDILNRVSGEIDRQLLATKIGATPADADDLVPDYPILPVRRRFWEKVLRAVDTAGMAGQLRTQLLIVHEATQEVAERPVGWVVAGDAIYGQIKPDMLQSGVLLREVDETIQALDDGTPDGALRARLCAAIFLIGKLPTGGSADTGIRATPDVLADLLVEDLSAGSAALRQRIPELLTGLVDAGTLMLVGDEYRLQTREGAQWETDYRARSARILADDSGVASQRGDELRQAVAAALKGITLTQGASRTPRKYELHFGLDAPSADGGAVPVWVRDEWSVSERAVREEARALGPESPVVSVFLPRRETEGLRAALVSLAAAKECVQAQPAPATPEGVEAQAAMQSRVQIERNRLNALVAEVIAGARVFQAGGNEVVESSVAASVQAAAQAALVRLFPQFDLADNPQWGKVFDRATEGSGDPLAALGFTGGPETNPVCQQVRAFLGASGRRGSEVRKHFLGSGYGWPQDAVDGALVTLVATGLARAQRNGQRLTARQIRRTDIGTAEFFSEGVTVTALNRIAIRQLGQLVGLTVKGGEEAEVVPAILRRLIEAAAAAGGEPPLPAPPSTEHLQDLATMAGNEQVVAVCDRQQQLRADYAAWQERRARIDERLPRWRQLRRLLAHIPAAVLAPEVTVQVDGIMANRALLADPDPVTPLLNQVTDALRQAVQATRGRLARARAQALADLQLTDGWTRLPEADRQTILQATEFMVPPDVEVGDPEALLATLDATPLSAWDDKVAAVPGRLAEARRRVADLIEPQAVHVAPRAATLKTTAEVEAYLEALRDELLGYIRDNRPVILG